MYVYFVFMLPRQFMDVGLSVYRQAFFFLRYICMPTYTPTYILTHTYKILHFIKNSFFFCMFPYMYGVACTHTNKIKHMYF